MKLRRRADCSGERFTNAFVGYDDESRSAVLELTHNWDTKAYEMGTGYGHVAIEVDDAHAACDAVRSRGGKVTRDAGPM
jgi:lactoylglutathione lyase